MIMHFYSGNKRSLTVFSNIITKYTVNSADETIINVNTWINDADPIKIHEKKL